VTRPPGVVFETALTYADLPRQVAGQARTVAEIFMSAILSFPAKALTFLKEVRIEMQRVSWPTRREVVRLTVIVVLVSAFVAALLGVFDYVFSRALFFVDDTISGGQSQPAPVPFGLEGTDQQEVTIPITTEQGESTPLEILPTAGGENE